MPIRHSSLPPETGLRLRASLHGANPRSATIMRTNRISFRILLPPLLLRRPIAESRPLGGLPRIASCNGRWQFRVRVSAATVNHPMVAVTAAADAVPDATDDA